MKQSAMRRLRFNRIVLSVLLMSVSFSCGLEAKKKVALTIDDGPRPAVTEKLMSILDEHGVTATFFLVGLMVERYPDIVRRIYAEGFEIGNHTYSDTRLTSMNKQEVEKALSSFDVVFEKAVAARTTYFRPPGGRYNQTVLDTARNRGFSIVMWTRLVKDTEPDITPEKIYNLATRNPRDREIILLHDGPKATVKALPAIIEFYKSRGYEFVSVSALSPPVFKDSSVASLSGSGFRPYLNGQIITGDKDNEAEGRIPLSFAGVFIVFAGAGSIIFIFKIKNSGPVNGGKSISVVFLGGNPEKISMIANIFNRNKNRAVFFVTEEELNKFSEELKDRLQSQGHSIAFREGDASLPGSVFEKINRWLAAAGGLRKVAMPLFYSSSGYSTVDIKKIKEINFFPVSWKVAPPSRIMNAPEEIADYALKKTGRRGVVALYPENIRTAGDISIILKCLTEAGYDLVALDSYLIKNRAA